MDNGRPYGASLAWQSTISRPTRTRGPSIGRSDNGKSNELKLTTDNEVRSGAQTMLANFIPTTQINTKYTTDQEHTFDNNDQEESLMEDAEDFTYLHEECDLPIIPDWSGMMLDPPNYLHSLEEK
eukprot:scaffold8733_cov52-Attheya_sp.AAC.4